MTKPNYTHIIFVLDRSGSMMSVRDDTIGGFNRFLNDQKKVAGTATVTTVLFDAAPQIVRWSNTFPLSTHDVGDTKWPAGDWYMKPHDFVNIQDVPSLSDETYQPRGGTALLDACRRAIEDEGKRLAAMPESQRPSQVICVIMTDGQENMSQKTTNEQLQSMLTHQRDTFKWEFVFLGANQDAFASAEAMGVRKHNAINYVSTGDGVRGAFDSLSHSMKTYRSTGRSTTESFFDGQTTAPELDANNVVTSKPTTSTK